ncbi:glucokinase 1-like protein [Leishmania mexicana MHOM/GT/2001/U1103]|uniref:Glucokinase 1-like protein n=1 Tax=Leishmania mexicana (strain MHOM/GT/2001/U1103) TaxID=929439 RepID=E9AT09_LEIMU|nr:glucokinase 1-like protein [Leishmania mexicana MHOM/GT/2001/U1103]CBZ26083.1 glucokinase 1-like protein [Leishmania mexicana MHOM/GT/2001/U1103]
MSLTVEIQLEQLAPTIKGDASWSTGPIYVVCDVGGTNARVGFAQGAQHDRSGLHIIYVRFKVTKHDIRQLLEFFDAVLQHLKKNLPNRAAHFLRRVASGAVSVPGPVTNGQLGGPFNNLKGIAQLADYPAELFPKGRSALLNDLEAGSYGVLALSNAGMLSDYFKVMWKGTQWDALSEGKPVGSTIGRGRCMVVAPGTGVGSSLIHYVGVSDSYVVLALECGCLSMSWCANEDSKYVQALAGYMASKARVKGLGSTVAPIWEAATNGSGLEFNYAYEKEGPKASALLKSAHEVAKLAKGGSDPAAMAAMDRLYKNLMGLTAETTMQFLPLTCVLMGDSIVSNSFYFDNPENVKRLKARINEHTMERQLKFLSRTTFLRQVRSVNINLLGCLGFGSQLSNPADQLAPTKSHL